MVDIAKMLKDDILKEQIRKSDRGEEYGIVKGTYSASGITSSECLLRSLTTRKIMLKDYEEGSMEGRMELFSTDDDADKGRRKMRRGDALHVSFVDMYLRNRNALEGGRTTKQYPSKLLPGRSFSITGKYDVYDIKDNMIVEFKSTNKYGFEGTKNFIGSMKQPHGFHVEQANVYAIMNDVPAMKIVYIECDELKIAEHVRMAGQETFEKSLHIADLLFYSEMIEQVHPDILKQPVEKWRCSGCPLLGGCPMIQRPSFQDNDS